MILYFKGSQSPEIVPSKLYNLFHPDFRLGAIFLATEVAPSASLPRWIVQITLRKILVSQSGKCRLETAKGHSNVVAQGEMDRAALKGLRWLGPGDFLNAVEPGSSRGAGKWILELSPMSDYSAGPGGWR